MLEMGIRLSVLICIGTAVWLIIWLSRRFIEAQRRQALAAAPLRPHFVSGSTAKDAPEAHLSPVRILAFSSADCQQCHRLQTPALQRVVAARGNVVEVTEVDAATEHELVQSYHVLTVPSTVVLDATGKAQAINYGFANTQRLLQQVDEVLVKAMSGIHLI
jgi:hypothetical protein